MSAVPKKDGILQRKLLMLCSTNYWFSDVKSRADLGMCGGASLSRGHATDSNYYMASCDEDSAFTHIETPNWMWAWSAAPPLLAYKVRNLIPEGFRSSTIDPYDTWVAPLYTRLAMGGSHSVYILMQINLFTSGKALYDYSKILGNTAGKEEVDTYTHSPSDISPTASLQPSLLEEGSHEGASVSNSVGTLGNSGWTVSSWCSAVRRAKRSDERVFVIMLLFSSERREGDLAHWLGLLAREAGIQILVLTADLREDEGWDLANPKTFARLYQLCAEGLIDIIFGGPSCSTVSRPRHLFMVSLEHCASETVPGVGQTSQQLKQRWLPLPTLYGSTSWLYQRRL